MQIKTLIKYFLLMGVLAFLCGCSSKAGLTVRPVNGNSETLSGTVAVDDTDNTSESESDEAAGDTLSENDVDTDDEDDIEVCVYVCGAVLEEGVYYLDSGSRKQDALNMAGGYAEDAAIGYINLAEKVTDGERIYFPYQDEVSDINMISADNSDNESSELNENDLHDAADEDYRVNINTADKEELMTLPGIGEAKAQLIIDYREENGFFKSVEELMNIDGIKEGVFNKIKDFVTV